MNCREAQNNLFTDRDGALAPEQRAALEGHLAECAGCRRVKDDLAAALSSWRDANARTVTPDPEREWHALRRTIRGGEPSAGARTPARRLLPWLALPLAGAAALALALFTGEPSSDNSSGARRAEQQIARADSVEVSGNASTMVYVDDKSGWLIVWAADAKQI
jgi:anti-sigma factor RsiW